MADKTDQSEHYEKLGRMIVELNDYGITPARKYYSQAFIRGLIGGFGGVVGATLVVAVLLWVLSLFHQVPFLGRFSDNVRSTLNTSQQKQ